MFQQSSKPFGLIAVAFSVDVAFMQLTRTELRTSTDAAAAIIVMIATELKRPSFARSLIMVVPLSYSRCFDFRITVMGY